MQWLMVQSHNDLAPYLDRLSYESRCLTHFILFFELYRFHAGRGLSPPQGSLVGADAISRPCVLSGQLRNGSDYSAKRDVDDGALPGSSISDHAAIRWNSGILGRSNRHISRTPINVRVFHLSTPGMLWGYDSPRFRPPPYQLIVHSRHDAFKIECSHCLGAL
ncbi:hypothetical protein BKA93DRAFT_509252 [Sparassis latifolia]